MLPAPWRTGAYIMDQAEAAMSRTRSCGRRWTESATETEGKVKPRGDSRCPCACSFGPPSIGHQSRTSPKSGTLITIWRIVTMNVGTCRNGSEDILRSGSGGMTREREPEAGVTALRGTHVQSLPCLTSLFCALTSRKCLVTTPTSSPRLTSLLLVNVLICPLALTHVPPQ